MVSGRGSVMPGWVGTDGSAQTKQGSGQKGGEQGAVIHGVLLRRRRQGNDDPAESVTRNLTRRNVLLSQVNKVVGQPSHSAVQPKKMKNGNPLFLASTPLAHKKTSMALVFR